MERQAALCRELIEVRRGHQALHVAVLAYEDNPRGCVVCGGDSADEGERRDEREKSHAGRAPNRLSTSSQFTLCMNASTYFAAVEP